MSGLISKVQSCYTSLLTSKRGEVTKTAILTPAQKKINYIKRRHGLVPLEHETPQSFFKRVKERIEQKRNPADHPMLDKSSIDEDYTKKIQKVSMKYLNIEEEPVDGFRTKKSLSTLLAGGYTLPDIDGSMIVCIQSGTDNYQEIVANLTEGLEQAIERKLAYGQLHKKMISDFMKNEDHIILHEDCHAIEMNNKPEEVEKIYYKVFTKNDKPKKSAILAMRLPVFKMYYKLDIMKHSIETETIAYKTAFDCFTDEAFKDAEKELKEKGVDTSSLDDILERFKTKNSILTEKIIKNSYIGRQGYKGPVKTAIGVGLALLIGNWCLGDEKPLWNYFNGTSENEIWNFLGTWFYLKSIDKMTGFTFGIPLRHKIRKCRKIYDKAVDKFGSASDAFYETLGLDFHKMEAFLEDKK